MIEIRNREVVVVGGNGSRSTPTFLNKMAREGRLDVVYCQHPLRKQGRVMMGGDAAAGGMDKVNVDLTKMTRDLTSLMGGDTNKICKQEVVVIGWGAAAGEGGGGGGHPHPV